MLRVNRTLVVAVVMGWYVDTAQAEFRTWRAATGPFTTVAEYVSLKSGGIVALKLQSGDLREVPLEKLCAADREYVRKHQAPAAEPAKSSVPLQSEADADKALSAVDKDAQRSKTAEEAVVLYTIFLSDPSVPPSTRAKAEKKQAEWQAMADKGLVRTGTKWVTVDEARAGKIKAGFMINQGLELIRLSQDKLGFEKLQEASVAAPDEIYADFIMATVLAIGLQDFKESQRHYDVCLRRDPGNPAVLNNLALTEVKTFQPRDALVHWKSAAAICQDRRIAQNIGRLFEQAGKQRINVPKDTLKQLSDVYATLVISKNVSVAQSHMGWQYMLIPQEPPPDESVPAEASSGTEAGDPTISVCGTGFFVADHHVLTLRSATKGKADFLIADPANKGKTLPAKLVASSKDHDLALLECEGASVPPLPTDAERPRTGIEVLVGGYPMSDSAGTALKLARGNVMNNSTADRGVLPYEGANNPSVGGGPVIDSLGNVVAVHWKTINYVGNRYGAGIPFEKALWFMRESKPEVTLTAANKADVPWNEIEARVAASTVVVLSKTPNQDVGLSKRVGEGYLVDYSCCRCNGMKTVRCLNRSCINGGIANVRQQVTGRNPQTGQAMTEDVRFYTPCPVCAGTGKTICPICGGSGVDADITPPRNRSKLMQVPNVGS